MPGCSWVLGDSRCTINLATLEKTGSVTSVARKNAGNQSDRRDFTDTSRTEAKDYFALGTVTFTTGANAGQSSEIKDYEAGRFFLWKPLLYPIAAGDQYKARPGCDLRIETCKTKFNNLINFGGFGGYPPELMPPLPPNQDPAGRGGLPGRDTLLRHPIMKLQ
jgi:uncharacterized phage protein (TIGR02218 family)